MKRIKSTLSCTAFGALMLVSTAAGAVDGVILMDQNRALAGNVTPGHAAGFPVTISRPGSYRLSGNLTVPDQNTSAIDITASNVTIDLNGFSILGVTTCAGDGATVTSCAPTGTGRGIQAVPVNLLSIEVHNGTVRGMGSFGIFLQGRGHLVQKVRADSNGGSGILIVGAVTHSMVTLNGGSGIVFGIDGNVSHNTVSGNAEDGIQGLSTISATVSHNVAARNGGSGINLPASVGALISHNVARLNDRFGLEVQDLAGTVPAVGYTGNVFFQNDSGPVSGNATSLGHNLCGTAVC